MQVGPASIGEKIRGYVLEKVLGQGGMGCVYLAHHEHLQKKVAIKILDGALTDDQEFISRFFEEARIVNNVKHANIVDIVDFVDTQSPRRVAYIMEYVHGPSLSQALKRHKFTPVQALNICRQIAGALDAVHEINVVHRDLKPANILLMEAPDESDYSSFPSVKVVDFGIAKVTDDTSEHKTSTGALMGTPIYMSPEQVASDPVTSKTDVYALGEILFELVTGEPAFQGENLNILRQKLAHVPPKLAIDEEVPLRRELLGLVSNCLLPDPVNRPALAEVLEGLNFIQSKLESAPAATRHDSLHPNRQTVTKRPTSVMPPPRENPFRMLARQPRKKLPKYAMPVIALLVFIISGLFGIAYQNNKRTSQIIATPAVIETRTTTTAPATENTKPLLKVPQITTQKRDDTRLDKRKRRAKKPRDRRRKSNTFGTLTIEAYTTAGRQLSAKVTIDGRALPRKTPITIKARPGKRKITVQASGYPPISKAATVTQDTKSKVQVIVDL
ncbi:MAG: serine/threonine-protein kinase [Myxococcota bacterium]|nr:serine/threonine-protein kinase [Myxococcota bacterium]